MRTALVFFAIVASGPGVNACWPGFTVAVAVAAQRSYCDGGVLRYRDTGQEVSLFGVNYYVPHWQNYLELGTLGVDRDETIRNDLTHLKRMRLDLIRVHVFDREISDVEGNLRDNDHLRLLDRLIAEGRAGKSRSCSRPSPGGIHRTRTTAFPTISPCSG